MTAVGRSLRKRDVLGRLGAAAIAVDLLSLDSVRRGLNGHDVVVNLATHIPRSTLGMFMPGAWRENNRLRRDASAILVSAALAARVSRFIQESYAVYADHRDVWIDESAALAPVRYNRTVLDAERSVDRFCAAGGTGVALRFAWFYGPDAFQTTDGIWLARQGWAPIPGPADAFVSSVAHDDAAAAVFAAIELPAGTYNVTDDNPLTRKDFAAAMADVLGLPPLRPLPPWTTKLGGSLGKFLTRSQRVSNKKLRDASSWRPRFPSVREGLQVTVEILRAREAKALETVSRARS